MQNQIKKMLSVLLAILQIVGATSLAEAIATPAALTAPAPYSYADAKVQIESDWVVGQKSGKDYIQVKVYFVDAVDLKSWNLVLNYDADIFNFMSKAAGADAKAVASYCESTANAFTDESNPNVDGEIKVGGYFKEALWDAETFYANSNFDGECIVNDEKFETSIFYLEVEDMEAFESESTTISIAGDMEFDEKKSVSDEITHIPGSPPPSMENAGVKIESDWVIDEYGTIAVKVYFTDAVGLKSWNMALNYDADIFDFDTSVRGKDANAVKEKCDSVKNDFMDDSNANTDGEIRIGGYFKESLRTAEEFLADSKQGEQCVVNSDKFEANVFYLKVTDLEAFKNSNTTITMTGYMRFDAMKTVSDEITKPTIPDIPTPPSMENAGVKIETDWVIDEYGTIAVKVYFTDAVGLKSWNLHLNYDADIFDYDVKEAGKDAAAVQNSCDYKKNSFTNECYPNADGEIKVGGYFKETLWTSEEFLAASKQGEQCVVNSDKFESNIFYLKVTDLEAFESESTTISIAGDMEFDEKKSISDEITKIPDPTPPSMENAGVKIESDWVVGQKSGKDYIQVKVYFVDAVDLKSWNLILTYDADIFNFMSKVAGADAKAVADYCDSTANSFTDESNPNVDGEIKVGGYFKEVLWDAETFYNYSNFDGDCIVNDEKFEASIFYLEVEDMEAFESEITTISIAGDMVLDEIKSVSDEITKIPDPTPPSMDEAKVKIESDWVIDAYGTIPVKVYFTDAVGLKSWNLHLNYDADIFDFDTSVDGKDAEAVKHNCDPNKNSFTDESTPYYDGDIKVGGYFKETLWTAEEFLAASKRGEECIVNSDKFESNIFYLKVMDKAAFEYEDITITIAGDIEMEPGERKSVSDEIIKIPIHRHTWGNGVVTTEPTCTEYGVMTYTCQSCGDTYTESIAKREHNYSHIENLPTCTTVGYIISTCIDCGDSYITDTADATGHTFGAAVPENRTEPTCTEDGSYDIVVYCANCPEKLGVTTYPIPAIGHTPGTAATCTEDQTCTVCGKVLNGKFGHAWDAGVVTTAPTCTEDGVKTFTCGTCNDTYTESVAATGHAVGAGVMENKVNATCTEDGSYDIIVYCAKCPAQLSTTPYVIPATGHTPGAEATCTEDQICTVCDTILNAKHGHTEMILAAKDATCEESGLTEGKQCFVCGEMLAEQEVVSALGHNYESVVTAPTCTAVGYTIYTCATCGDTYTADEVASLGHNYTGTVTTEPTCTEDGVKTFTCSICDDTYTEVIAKLGHTTGAAVLTNKIAATCTANGSYDIVVNCAICSAQLSTTPYVIPATGHTPGAEATCTEDQICTVCDTILNAKHGHTEMTLAAKDATCEESGLTEGKQCSVCGEVLAEQEVVSALGHNYAGTVTTEPTCTEDGMKTFTCSICDDTYIEVIAKLGHTTGAAVLTNKIAATCTADGSYDIVVNCAICSAQLSTTPYVIPATGHTPGTEATCTEDQICTVCGEVLNVKHGHTEMTLAAKDATCEESGLTEGKQCSVCGEVLAEQEVVSALGHSYESVVIAPTCTAVGYTIYTCATCGDTYTADEFASLGHNYTGTVTTEPTCTKDGVKTFTCSICDDTYTEVIAKLGHTTGAAVLTNKIAATCTADGSYDIIVYCAKCSAQLNVTSYPIAATGHHYVSVETVPTCVAAGYTLHVCSGCSDSYTDTEVAALGHDWSDWTLKTPATQESAGEEIRTCATCGTQDVRVISKIEVTETPAGIVIQPGSAIGKVMMSVAINTTVADLLAASNATAVLDKDGAVVAPETALATGMKLVILDGETITDSMTVAVLGDVDGNGEITAGDARMVLRVSVGLENPSGACLLAARVGGGEEITAGNARSILRASVGLDDPEAWLANIG